MLSSVFLTLSLVLACLFGSGDQPWSWGCALVALAGALIAAALEQPREAPPRRIPVAALLLPLAAAGYLIWRAWISPVREHAVADILLVGAALGTWLWALLRGSSENSIRFLLTGTAVIVLANVVVAGMQFVNPEFSILGGPRHSPFATGLFTSPSYFADFMLGCGLFLLLPALFRSEHGLLRTLWGLASIAAFVAVALSRSRGGVIALAVGGVLLLLVLFPLLRQRSIRGLAAMLLALPVVLAGVWLAGNRLLMAAQQAKQQALTFEAMLDNKVRLNFLGVAFESFLNHPWIGGGSQSFRWEVFQLWHVGNLGFVAADPVYVHNEFMQALTDYGIVGVVLIGIPLALVLLLGFSRCVIVQGGARSHGLSQDAPVLAGAVVGLGAILIHSNFDFVFHTLPPVMLLGLFTGMVTRLAAPARSTSRRSLPLAVMAVALALALLPSGVRGARVTALLLPVRSSDLEARLRRAIEVWPASEFQLSLGHDLFRRANEEFDASTRDELMDRAIDAYAAASGLNPFDPESDVNRARVLSLRRREAEAEAAYARAVELQGPFEIGFKANLYFAEHLLRKAWRLTKEQQYEDAGVVLAEARKSLARSLGLTVKWLVPNGLAAVERSMNGLDAYLSAHRAYDEGYQLWQSRQPERALARFKAGLKTLTELRPDATGRMPPDPSEGRLRQALETMVAFLEGAGIKPAESP